MHTEWYAAVHGLATRSCTLCLSFKLVGVQANTVPATFWSLGFLLLPENGHRKQQILASLQSVQPDSGPTSLSDHVQHCKHLENAQTDAKIGAAAAQAGTPGDIPPRLPASISPHPVRPSGGDADFSQQQPALPICGSTSEATEQAQQSHSRATMFPGKYFLY